MSLRNQFLRDFIEKQKSENKERDDQNRKQKLLNVGYHQGIMKPYNIQRPSLCVSCTCYFGLFKRSRSLEIIYLQRYLLFLIIVHDLTSVTSRRVPSPSDVD